MVQRQLRIGLRGTPCDLQFRRRWFSFDAESFNFRPFRLTFDFLSLIS
jgi:hypothetical protein